MAGEISYSIFYSMANSGSKASRTTGTVKVDQAAVGKVSGVQEIGTSAEAIALGDLSTPGLAYLHNMDDTNFILIGYDDSGFKDLVKLEPGDEQWLRFSQAVPQAKADTAACDLEYEILEA